MRWIEVVPAGSSTSIALTPPMEGGPTSVDNEVARWGAPVPPMFRLRDPAGNSLTIVEPTD